VSHKTIRENSQLTRIVLWDTQIMDEELRDWMYSLRKEKEKRLQDLFDEAIQRGEIRSIDTYLAALLVEGVISSMWGPLVLEAWDVDAPTLARELTDMIMRGIK